MAQRSGRLFIDYLRNGWGTTAGGAYFATGEAGLSHCRPRDLAPGQGRHPTRRLHHRAAIFEARIQTLSHALPSCIRSKWMRDFTRVL
jgi:DNA primase